MVTNVDRIQEYIEKLSKFNSTPGKGITRLTFTKEDRGAREYIKSEMVKSGLKVYEDAVGTVVGRLEGEDKFAPVIMVGSHFDSVKNGGKFDGAAGVVMGLEIARVIRENNIKLKHPIEFVAMIEEEGGRFGRGLFASRAAAGKVTREELYNSKDESGISIAEAMKEFGLDPEKIYDAKRRPEDIKAFIELHIEQGPILEKKDKDIGIVEYIVGLNQIEIVIKGRPDHAGTTPMNMRSDALDAASNVISKISSIAKKVGGGTVATVGTLKVLPGASNIVPGEVIFSVDIRSKDKDCIKKVKDEMCSLLQGICKEKNVKYTIEEKIYVNPVKMDENIVADFNDICNELGFSSQPMLSGAGHDAMIMAEITKVGLIFVKSKDGRSHCPEEWTDYKDLQKGIEVAYKEVLKLGGVISYGN